MSLFYIFATGPSINDITDDEWGYIKDKETLGISHFPLKGVKTKYYYSHEYVRDGAIVLDKMKKDGYTDTRLFLFEPKTVDYAKKIGFQHITRIRKGQARVPPMHEPYEHFMAKSIDQPIFRPRGTLAAAINVALILGASEIRLCGVDLNNQEHFYDEMNDYKKFSEEHKKIEDAKHKNLSGWDRERIHSTACDREGGTALDVIAWINDYMKRSGRRLYCCNHSSMLVTENVLDFKGIMDE